MRFKKNSLWLIIWSEQDSRFNAEATVRLLRYHA
jgi:hypothetical protein